jgi:RNA recognition motif-containing protein
MMVDMNEERLATIHENIAAGRAPNEEKAKVKGAVTVFIGNLPFNYGDDEIEAIFEPFGKVFISFIISLTRYSRGCTFANTFLCAHVFNSTLLNLTLLELTGGICDASQASRREIEGICICGYGRKRGWRESNS